MSVLINMEMPNKKNGAVLIIYPDGNCAFEDGKTYQAVPVLKHGRCIDADALMELYADTDDLRLKDMKVPIAVIRQNIMDMPTIIPASEEGET